MSTIVNGAHIFHVKEQSSSPHCTSQFSSSDVETYPCDDIGCSSKGGSDEAILSSCFIRHGQAIVLGSFNGNITLISRHSRGVLGSCFAPQTVFANNKLNSNVNNNYVTTNASNITNDNNEIYNDINSKCDVCNGSESYDGWY